MIETMNCYASAAFGLEGLVASELREMNLSNVTAENGGVRFNASPEELFLCNLRVHYCERVFILAAEKPCHSFEDLFQLVLSVPWDEYTDGRESYIVTAKCARSQLMSPRDCQSVAKKALLEKLRLTSHLSVFPEDGPAFPVLVSVHSNLVKILINTSGEALSRRGYRTWNGQAPLRETLAAALVRLSGWNSSVPLYDPCCGTGTILTEAALMACHSSPGIRRNFAMESFAPFRSLPFGKLRDTEAGKAIRKPGISIRGSDIDPDAITLAERHIHQAGLKGVIHVSVQPLQKLSIPEPKGVFICNPPYGERISDRKSCQVLYKELRALKERHPSWTMCIISSDPAFERCYGKKANKKRRLYNGRLECTYYIYI